MLSKHSLRVRGSNPSADRASATPSRAARPRPAFTTRLAALALMAASVAILPACSSGSGGDNGANPPRDEITPQGLNFTYPFDGQLDVVLDSQMVINFPAAVSLGEDALVLKTADGATDTPSITVTADDGGAKQQDNIVRLKRDGDLLPNTVYQVVANSDISAGSTTFSEGDVLFKFRTRPMEGRPAAGDFAVTSLTPGEENELTPDRSSKFTQFNAIRVVFNEPVDPATVDDGSFIVTGPDGDQITTDNNGGTAEARLTALGRYIVFDPLEDLAPGEYTIQYTDAIKSVFGNSLKGDTKTRTVLSVGDTPPEQFLVIEEDASKADYTKLPEDFLGGRKANNVRILSQLIGLNNQPVVGPEDVSAGAAPIRNRVASTLAEPGLPGFDDVFPAVIRAGQKFQLNKLTLKLGGGIETPVISGPIDVNFPNDVSVYLQSNDYRNIETPTAVRLRLDLSIGTLITATAGTEAQKYIIQQLANGVFNQSVLNIQAAGLAIPRDNGDLEISTLGTFPINVNRTDNATVDFGLTLVLPANPDAVPEGTSTKDEVPPFITAQSPSACLYAFGSPGYNSFYTSAAPTAFPEPFCVLPLNGQQPPNGGLGVSVNSFPIESSPAVTFSSPIDPASVNAGSIRLVGGSGVVPATYRVEGFSVVIDPDDLLQSDTGYQIQLNQNSTLKDLAGNDVTFDNRLGPTAQTLAFRTEPQVADNSTPALLGTLTPGIPCALAGGDFDTGGGTAGNCGNDADNGTAPDYPVFTSPVDVPVDGIFSKFVKTDSLVLANGCLTGGGSGDANDVPKASIALQEMNESGQCVGTPDAELAFAGSAAPTESEPEQTRAFTIRPTEALKNGTRYWIVICGQSGTDCVNNGGTVTDIDGLALNTNPLNSTGSTATSPDAAGGPDILMPFDTIAPNKDYYTNQFTLPESDTNGNGQFDDDNGDGEYQPGDERPQPGNRALVNLAAELPIPTPENPTAIAINNANRADGAYPSYLGLARPIALREITDTCEGLDDVVFDNGESAIGGDLAQCIPASLLPGGINNLSSINLGVDALGGLIDGLIGELPDATGADQIPVVGPILSGTFGTVGEVTNATTEQLSQILASLVPADAADLAQPIQTGRVLLRFPNVQDESGNDAGTQTGYIVESCIGTIVRGAVDPEDGTAPGDIPDINYDYEPCFAASLKLVANAPDGQVATLDQQKFTANIVGPVTFEQNGRLVISVRNTNTLTLNANLSLGPLPAADATATILPGNLNFQLVGNAAHGGRAFPNR